MQNSEFDYRNERDLFGRDLLYIASKYGHYECVKILLLKKFLIYNENSTDSTALHAAAYYGYEDIVKLLLEFGASNAIKNQYGNYPSDETTESIKNIILQMNDDKISDILSKVIEKNIGLSITPLTFQKKVIGKRIQKLIIDDNGMHISLIEKFIFLKKYQKCYHGTKFNNLLSILQYGFIPPGQETPEGIKIEVQPNHYQLNKKFYELENWANAIFISPSLFYSCQNIYSEIILSNKEQWICIIECRVENDIFLKQKGAGYETIINEPNENEYRIEGDLNKFIYPTAILFVKKIFIEETKNYNDWIDAGEELNSQDTIKRLNSTDFNQDWIKNNNIIL